MSPSFGFRDVLRAFGEPPGRFWPAGVIHHGARLLILVALALSVSLFFPVSPVPDLPVLERGMVAQHDVIASTAFTIRKSEAELARERAEAAASVEPIFAFDPAAVDTMLVRVRNFMARVDSAAVMDEEVNVRATLRQLLLSYGFSASDETWIELLRSDAQRDMLAGAVERAIRTELPPGVAQGADLEEARGERLWIRRGEAEQFLPRESVLNLSRFVTNAARHLPADASPQFGELHRLILIRFFEPSIKLDREATAGARERARAAVSEIKEEVLRDQRIVTAHEVVDDRAIERYRAYQEHLRQAGGLDPMSAGGRRVIGAFLFNVFVLGIFGLLLCFYRKNIYSDLRHVSLIAVLLLAVVAAAAVIARQAAPVELIPMAFAVLVVASLWDGRLGLTVAMTLAVLLSGQVPFLGLTVLFTCLMGGAAAALGIRVVRSRLGTWAFILIIASSYVAAAITLGLLRSWPFSDVLWSAGWGGINAVASTLIATGFMPLFEAYTRITTSQTLIELNNQDRPLLRRLSREAPGTLAHSISMAALVESAARAIGANGLLARVGCYYHDIGKMAKPQYFIENQLAGRNPHDKLKPATSAAIVREHVTEGLRMADEAKLPDSIKAFIAEHHGTLPIGFFLERAREQDPDADLDPDGFHYPGPRPQSKETAIALLADSVESATRALQDATPERIEALVHRIVDERVRQGQLDETPLTLGEIKRIKDEFIKVLTGMYHQRIDYPQPREVPQPAAVGQAAEAGGHRR